MRAIFGILLCLAVGSASADTIVVDPGGGGDFTTIQAAVDAASDYDLVQILPGIYTENIVFPVPTPSITLESVMGAEATIIDGGGHGKCIKIFDISESLGTIRGLTIKNSGSGYERDTYNSGIFISVASTSEWVIEDCIFIGHPNCCITLYNTSAPIRRNLFLGDGWGIWVAPIARGFVTECTFVGAEEAIIADSQASQLFVRQCLFSNVSSAVVSDAAVSNTTDCNGFYFVQTDYTNCGPGVHDVHADPQFCGVGFPPASDYWLQSDSPMRADATGYCGTIGFYDVGCGSNAAENANWSRIKSAY